MIHEIVIQHVEPEKREEYIRIFGDILKKPITQAPTGSSFSPASKIRAA